MTPNQYKFDRLAQFLDSKAKRVGESKWTFSRDADTITLTVPSLQTVLQFDSHGMYHIVAESKTFHAWSDLQPSSLRRPSMQDLFDGSQSTGDASRTTILTFLDTGQSWRNLTLPCGIVANLWDFVAYALPKA